MSATLSILRADGKAHAVAAGYLHLRSRPEAPVALDLGALCVTLAPGEALRLSIAASDFPAHPVNPGTGADPVSAPLASALITTLHLSCGEDSRLDLPLAGGALQLR